MASCAVAVGLVLQSVAPARAADADDVRAAEALADEAYAQHAAGKYAEAIGTYLKAYELSRAGAILFNIAAIYDRKLGERGLAIEYYRRYVQAPDATPEFVQKATVRLSALRREANEEQARSKLPSAPAIPPIKDEEPAPAEPIAQPVLPPAQDVIPAPSRGTAWGGWRTAGFVVGGVGLAGLGTSLALGLVAKTKNDDAKAVCDESTCATERGVTLDHQAAGFATAATITFIAGAVLVATGVTLYFIAPRAPASAARVSLDPQWSANGAGLVIRGSL